MMSNVIIGNIGEVSMFKVPVKCPLFTTSVVTISAAQISDEVLRCGVTADG